MRKVILFCTLVVSWGTVNAVDNNLPRLTASELRDVVAPVALYPDDLLSVVLPAATQPLQVVQARQRIKDNGRPDANWDPAVVALMNYPEVVDFLFEDIEWMETLGIVFASQEGEVFAAVQDFRSDALAAGNLKSDQYQTVRVDNGAIRIDARGGDELYVPYYEPEKVVVRVAEPVYHYYPVARPVYYYPYPTRHRFYGRPYYGVNTYFSIGWQKRGLGIFYTHQSGHPYASHSFSTNIHYYKPKRYYGNGGHHYHRKHHRPHYKQHSRQKRHYKTHRKYRDNHHRGKAHHQPHYKPRHKKHRSEHRRAERRELKREHRRAERRELKREHRREHRRADRRHDKRYSVNREKEARRHDRRRTHGVKQPNSRRDYARDQRQVAREQNSRRDNRREARRDVREPRRKANARNIRRAAMQPERRAGNREARRMNNRQQNNQQQRFSGNRDGREARRNNRR